MSKNEKVEEIVVSFILGKLTSDGVITNEDARKTKQRYRAEKNMKAKQTA